MNGGLIKFLGAMTGNPALSAVLLLAVGAVALWGLHKAGQLKRVGGLTGATATLVLLLVPIGFGKGRLLPQRPLAFC